MILVQLPQDDGHIRIRHKLMYIVRTVKDPMIMHDSKRDVANLLHEEAGTRSIRECLRQKQQRQAQQKQTKKKNRDSWER